MGAFSTELHRSPDELDGMVECDVLVVAAAGEDAAAVQLPPAGVARHGQGAHAGQVLQRGRQVIRGQRVVAAGGRVTIHQLPGHHSPRDGDVRGPHALAVLAGPGGAEGAGGVGVVVVHGEAEQLDVVVGQLRDGAAAPARPAAAERVRRAAGHLVCSVGVGAFTSPTLILTSNQRRSKEQFIAPNP